jgi:hypothetical protein
VGNQYLDRKPAGADWLFKEFLSALTNRELRGVVEWQFEQMVCRACQDPCPEMCPRRRSAEHRLALARVELRRRAMFHVHVASRRR